MSDAAVIPCSYFVISPTGKILCQNSAYIRPTKDIIIPNRQVAANPLGFVRLENNNSTSLDPFPVISRPAFTPSKFKTMVTRFGRVIRLSERLNL